MITLAAYKALSFCLDSGFQEVIVESTDMKLISLLQNPDSYAFEIGDLLEDIRGILDQFRFISFKAIPSVCNETAAVLAGSVKESGNLSICYEDCPYLSPSISGCHPKFVNWIKECITNSRGGIRVAWDKVCLPDREGGLGLKRVEDWNRVKKTSDCNWGWKTLLKLREYAS
uniref:RNase H type-1 domain-containing protein n=1 Tax=Fagus sylvatica TaxID=28930 RepID=A0A2N9FDU8_FAGSY